MGRWAQSTTRWGSVFNLSPMGEWVSAAMCAQTDPELFFPEKGQSSNTARRVCRICPVVVECRDWAVRNHAVGVWGGTSEYERREIRAGRR